jgi:hypothetical protein
MLRLDMSEYAGYGAGERLITRPDGGPSELIQRIREQPFVVVLLRLYFDAWAYYVAGGALVVSTMVLFELDTAARDRSNAAEQAAEAAQRDYQAALAARQPGAPMLC